MKKTIAVIYGGKSGEHRVSRNSAASVVRNLDKQKWDCLLIGISMDGRWYLQDEAELQKALAGTEPLGLCEDAAQQVLITPGGGIESAFRLVSKPQPLTVDVVFPVLHGTYGEDGTIQGLFEMAGVPYVGSGVLGSASGMDKEKTKALWSQAGLPVVPWISVRAADWASEAKQRELAEKAERDFRYPVFVKPACAGSSVGAAKASDRSSLLKAVDDALRWDSKALIEPFINAREVECSVSGNERLTAYTPGEIVPHHEFYDYDAKYTDPDGATLLIPADMDEEGLKKIRQLATQAYRTAELCGLARVDFFVTRPDGHIYLNEVNTMPGFTNISMYPKMCEASGLPYSALLDMLAQLAEQRFAQNSQRSYTFSAQQTEPTA